MPPNRRMHGETSVDYNYRTKALIVMHKSVKIDRSDEAICNHNSREYR